MADGRADAAVHSAKDMPSTMGDHLVLGGGAAAGRPPRRPRRLHAGRPPGGRARRDGIGPAPGPAGLSPARPGLHRAARQHGPAGGRRRGRRGLGGRGGRRRHGAAGLAGPADRRARPDGRAAPGRPGRHRGAVPGRRRRTRAGCCAAIDHEPSHRALRGRAGGAGRARRELHRAGGGLRRGGGGRGRRRRRCGCRAWWPAATGAR